MHALPYRNPYYRSTPLTLPRCNYGNHMHRLDQATRDHLDLVGALKTARSVADRLHIMTASGGGDGAAATRGAGRTVKELSEAAFVKVGFVCSLFACAVCPCMCVCQRVGGCLHSAHHVISQLCW